MLTSETWASNMLGALRIQFDEIVLDPRRMNGCARGVCASGDTQTSNVGFALSV